MIVIGLSSYPLQSSEQAIKRAYDLPRLPVYIKGRGSYGYHTRERGAEGIQIYEFDSSKVEEAMWDILQPYTKFYDIPGYKYELKVAFKAREAMKRMLELK
jgi:hypothetical protein